MRFSLRDVLAGAGDIIARQAGDNNGQAESDSSRVSSSDTQSSTTGSNNVLNLVSSSEISSLGYSNVNSRIW